MNFQKLNGCTIRKFLVDWNPEISSNGRFFLASNDRNHSKLINFVIDVYLW